MDAFILQEINNMKELLKNVIDESENPEIPLRRQEYLDELYHDTNQKIQKLESKFVTFSSAENMLEYLQTADLYNLETFEYIFKYSEDGDICVYNLEEEEAQVLYEKSKESQEYWGAFLGVGGSIYDYKNGSALEYCKNKFLCHEWINVSPPKI